MAEPSYVGRFAPTPSGDLHLGSLAAALASWLQARKAGGRWLLRLDDLDPPRVEASALVSIPRCLEAHGLTWDGALLFESQRKPLYRQALEQLHQQGSLYSCACSRKQLAQTGLAGPEGPIYPGLCRNRPALVPGQAQRWNCRGQRGTLADLRHGLVTCDLEAELGDFVLWRADDQPAYHLASVVDEGLDGITELVRGDDLLFSSLRQVALRQALGLPALGHLHLPLVVDPQGQKLSKQSKAPPLLPEQAPHNLRQALAALGFLAPSELAQVPDLLAWALGVWNPFQLPPPQTY